MVAFTDSAAGVKLAAAMSPAVVVKCLPDMGTGSPGIVHVDGTPYWVYDEGHSFRFEKWIAYRGAGDPDYHRVYVVGGVGGLVPTTCNCRDARYRSRRHGGCRHMVAARVIGGGW
jgi:hypothetical protein